MKSCSYVIKEEPGPICLTGNKHIQGSSSRNLKCLEAKISEVLLSEVEIRVEKDLEWHCCRILFFYFTMTADARV